MATIKISELTELNAQPADGDLFPIVDASEALDADKTKKITFAYAVKSYVDAQIAALSATYPTITPAARVTKSSDTNISDNTETTLSFTTEIFDTDSIHNNTTNPERLTCVTEGLYLVWGNVQFEASSTGDRQILFCVNGTANSFAYQSIRARGAGPTHISLAAVYKLSAGDYVICRVTQNSGGTLAVKYNGLHSPIFGMTYVGRAS